ncbi:MAG: hypothetical protein R3A10_22145 [Caldilineaceae bacterium]
MVIDRDVPWIMSTVAGGPNYLTLFHMGLRATISSPQLTTINETVAEIVGNEVEAAVVARYYHIRPDAQEDATSAADVDTLPVVDLPPSGPTPFDFRTEMRRTRLMVDRPAGRRSRRGRGALHGQQRNSLWPTATPSANSAGLLRLPRQLRHQRRRHRSARAAALPN